MIKKYTYYFIFGEILKILVTGGAGFIGSHIVDMLIENGHDVSILDNLSTGNEKNLNSSAKFINGDILDKNLDLTGFECVIHEAAQINVRTSVENPSLDANINILGTVNILENSELNSPSPTASTLKLPVYFPGLRFAFFFSS